MTEPTPSPDKPAAERNEHNVDPAEVSKFEALAYRWWDTNGDFRPLHDINDVRLNYIADRVDLSACQAVDVGCGGGILSEAMAARGATVVGIDMGEAPLSVARLHAQESGIQVSYQQTTAEGLAETHADSFDVVTCLEMLEHVPDPASVVAACARLAKPGGQLFFSTINRNPKSYLMAVLGAEYVLGLLPKGTHDYGKFITPAELSRAIRQAGLRTTDIAGMSYNPFTRQSTLNDNVDVNYLIHAQRPALP